MSNLVIVESPAKAKTIQKYLGKGYDVIASMGHIRDLPKSKLGVDVENGFQPKYTDMKGKEDVIKQLKSHAICCCLSVLFCYAPICTGRSAQKQIVSLKLLKIAVKNVSMMNNIGEILFRNGDCIMVNFKSVILFYRQSGTFQCQSAAGNTVKQTEYSQNFAVCRLPYNLS